MLTAEAHIETARPSRYLVQLCKHFDNKGRHLNGHRPRIHGGGDAQASAGTHMAAEIRPDQIHVEWTDSHGTVHLPWGTCTLQAAGSELILRAESPDEESLRRLQDLVTSHITRFSRRDPLKVDWQLPEATAETGTSVRPAPARGTAGRRRPGWAGVATVAALAAVAAAHLGLGGTVLADTRWTGWAVGLVVTAVAVKLGIVGTLAIRRGRRRAGQEPKTPA
ncbi:DUF2218 domain-containing protein [Streptomyces sp. NPDC048417]|uniref:DUF2218 domain-containing protein n=1 Tax=Streptomyces sp. NPDC048417 TaxID=3155387 RepID=UPI00343BAC73